MRHLIVKASILGRDLSALKEKISAQYCRKPTSQSAVFSASSKIDIMLAAAQHEKVKIKELLSPGHLLII